MINYSPLSKRIFAGLIDYGIFYTLSFVYIFSFGTMDEAGTIKVQNAGTLPIIFLWFLYFPLAESISGQTVGKKIFKIKVVSARGSDASIGSIIVRRLFDSIDMLFFGLVGVLLIKSSAKSQRVGDQVGNTAVVILESTICEHCHTAVELNNFEIRKGEFICPECNELSYL